jgi:hypothetical protein
MFGLFFLIVIPLLLYFYVRYIVLISKRLDIFIKIPIFIIAFGLPISYPYFYKYTDNYKNFNLLCSQERVRILSSRKVDAYSADDFRNGYAALLAEPYKSFIYIEKAYLPQSKFRTEECKSFCLQGLYKKDCLENQCLIESPIAEGTRYVKFKTLYGGEDVIGGANTLLRSSLSQLVDQDNQVFAERYDYTFYPYGTGWAKILGAASGSAPSQQCSQFSRFNYYEITPPTN